MADHMNCYEVLGVGPGASVTEVHAAFTRRAITALGCESDELFGRAAKALEVLADPQARKRHDCVVLRCAQTARSGRIRDAAPRGREAGAEAGSSCREGHAVPPSFCERLRGLLSRLPPAARRQAISQRLTESQRLLLERWMQSSVDASAKTRGGLALSMRSLCRCAGRRGVDGYRPMLHLGSGLYAQASFSYDEVVAVGALGALIAARSMSRGGPLRHPGTCAPDGGLSLAMAEALRGLRTERLDHARRVFCQSYLDLAPVPRIYFRTRLSVSRGKQLSSPSRQDLDAALSDWHRLHLSRGARLRAGPTPKGLAAPLARGSMHASPALQRPGPELGGAASPGDLRRHVEQDASAVDAQNQHIFRELDHLLAKASFRRKRAKSVAHAVDDPLRACGSTPNGPPQFCRLGRQCRVSALEPQGKRRKISGLGDPRVMASGSS